MLAGGVALTPTYASYNKQQLAITKLAIKSVARLTKIAHWAERQFDFEVFFFLFFARFLFVFFLLLFCLLFLFCCRCCLLVVSGLRLCIRDVVVACRLSGMRTVPGDYEVIQMKCLRRPLHHRPGLLHFSSMFRCFASFPLHFQFYFLCWLRPEMRKFCMPKTEKIYENYCGNGFASLFPFIHFRSSMAIAKNVFQSISLEAAAPQPETEPKPETEPEPSCVIIILALFYAHPLAMVTFSPHWICIWFGCFLSVKQQLSFHQCKCGSVSNWMWF